MGRGRDRKVGRDREMKRVTETEGWGGREREIWGWGEMKGPRRYPSSLLGTRSQGNTLAVNLRC